MEMAKNKNSMLSCAIKLDSGKGTSFAFRVPEKEILWNTNDPNYYNNMKKEDEWIEISQIMDLPVEEIKSKINSLKGYFRRERSRIKKKTGTGKSRDEIYISKWYAFEAMMFLNDKDTPRPTLSTEMENTSYSDVDEDFDSPVTSTSNTTPRISKRKRKEDPRITEAYNILKDAASKDACSVFGEHVGNVLRKLDDPSRAIVQYQINSILFNIEMRKYNIPQSLGIDIQNVDVVSPSGNGK